jgi:hypothetical protein
MDIGQPDKVNDPEQDQEQAQEYGRSGDQSDEYPFPGHKGVPDFLFKGGVLF